MFVEIILFKMSLNPNISLSGGTEMVYQLVRVGYKSRCITIVTGLTCVLTSSSLCFMKLSLPMFNLYMFRIVMSSYWIDPCDVLLISLTESITIYETSHWTHS